MNKEIKNTKQETSIPIIDLNKPEQGDLMVKACLEHGFFYVDNREGQEINSNLVEMLQQKSQEFFSLSQAIKSKYAIEKSKFHRGYVGADSATKSYEDIAKNSSGPSKNLNESLGFFSPYFLNNGESDHNAYPSELGEGFKSMISEYFSKCLAIKDKVLRHLSPYLKVENVRKLGKAINSYEDAFNNALWTSRFLHYPPNNGTLTPHTDFGILTILHQDQQSGLQINFKDEWIPVLPIKNTFVINVGDILEQWSEGALKSTRHQVIYEGADSRYSFPFFTMLDKECEVYSLDKQWISQYEHLLQIHYRIIQYLSERVENPDECLKGMSPTEIDEFHQKVINSSPM